jgi:hypothetical protein
VKIHEDESLGQFCAHVRHAHQHFLKDGTPKEGKMKLTDERITRLDALGFE